MINGEGLRQSDENLVTFIDQVTFIAPYVSLSVKVTPRLGAR